MSLNGDVQKIRAKQVGVLMRHYRSSFLAEDERTGLTMEDVLERMAKVNQRYESSAPFYRVPLGIGGDHAQEEAAARIWRCLKSVAA